jgi:HSP20 family molecular chaperone IbpA
MTSVFSSPNYKERSRQTIANSKKEKDEIKFKETELGYHYELKIPGYIKEDFRFYISKNQLVITTEKEKNVEAVVDKEKHSYCYPSVLFKMTVPLPKKPIEKKITVEYRNEVLYFSLYKL